MPPEELNGDFKRLETRNERVRQEGDGVNRQWLMRKCRVEDVDGLSNEGQSR